MHNVDMELQAATVNIDTLHYVCGLATSLIAYTLHKTRL